MSLRKVKQIQEKSGQQQLQSEQKQKIAEEEEEIIEKKPQKQFFNQFFDDESDESDSNDEQEDNKKEKNKNESQQQNQQQQNTGEDAPNKKKKKKNKKKNKNKKQEQQQPQNSTSSQQQQQETQKQKQKPNNEKKDEDMLFLEKVIEQKKLQENQNQNEEEKKVNLQELEEKKQVNLASCLEIKLKLLNYNAEMQKYFKNAKLTEAPNTNDLDAKQQKYLKMMQGRQQTRYKKSYYLSYDYKPIGLIPEKLQCEFLEINQFGQKVFYFEPSKRYQQLQDAYEGLKNTYDPNNIFDFLNQNPFHLEALYDVGEFCRLQGNYKEANSLLQQILFLYEESFSFEFKEIFTDTINQYCLAWDKNKYSKTFFLALLKFIDILGKKGCYRSALEYNKFLIKLNPLVDPAGALFILDYNSISAQNYDFLIFFTRNYAKEIYKNESLSIQFLPNFIYSCALAKFSKKAFPKIVGKRNNREDNQQNDSIDIDELLKFNDEDFEKAIKFEEVNHLNENANVLFLTAILLYPNVILQIININEIHKQNVSKSYFQNWQKKGFKDILAHKFFTENQNQPYYSFLQLQKEDDLVGLQKIIEIYLDKSKILWKNNQIIIWMKAALGFLLNKIEEINTETQQPKFDYSDFVEKMCSQNFNKNIPFSLSKFKKITKHDFTDSGQQLDLNNIPDNAGFQQQVPQQNPNYNPINTNQNLLGLIFNSLLPWNHLPVQQQNENQQQQNQNMDINQLQQNIQNLMQQQGQGQGQEGDDNLDFQDEWFDYDDEDDEAGNQQ